MRNENRASAIAIAVPTPVVLGRSWAIATRRMGALTATTETYLAFALITRLARKLTYALGILYGLFVWTVAERFGGSYVPGTTTDVGAAIVYSLVFWALLLVDAGRMSLDRWIASTAPAWRRISG